MADYVEWDGYGRRSSHRSGSGGLILAAIGAVLIGLFFIFANYYGTIVWWAFRSMLFWIVPLVVIAATVLGLAVASDSQPSRGGSRGLLQGLAVLVGIGGLATFFWYTGSYHSYQVAKEYSTSVQYGAGEVPSFEQRAPYTVAEAQARPNLGSYPGDIVNTSYVPEGDRYTSLVTRRGWLAGYQVVLEQSIPLTGRGQAKDTCEFGTNASAKIGGYFSHNLGREIANVQRGWMFDDGDAYAICDNGRPLVIVPMKRQVGGLFVVTQQFAGDAVYDGRSGAVTIVTDPKEIAKIPGPTYPQSLAETQRESTQALGSYGDWVFGRAGYETTSEAGTFDVNSGNTSEFVISEKGANHAVYLTPLTGRGSATSISALSVLDPNSTGLAPLIVYKLDPTWSSTDAIDSRIKADFQDLPNWLNIKVMEIIPLDGDRWVATLGNGQNVLYRIEGDGTLIEDKTNQLCLYGANGVKIRCGTVVDTNGNGPGVALGPQQPGGVVAPNGDVTSLSDQQLAELLNRVNAEAARRLAQSQGTR